MSKLIVKLSKEYISTTENAREARWELGNAILNEFFQKIGGEIVTNKSVDKDAMTVAEFAKANHKAVGKSFDAYKVFLSEAKNFALKHKTLASALKDTIKSEPTTQTRFNAHKVVEGWRKRFTPAQLKAIKALL